MTSGLTGRIRNGYPRGVLKFRKVGATMCNSATGLRELLKCLNEVDNRLLKRRNIILVMGSVFAIFISILCITVSSFIVWKIVAAAVSSCLLMLIVLGYAWYVRSERSEISLLRTSLESELMVYLCDEGGDFN